MIPWFIDFLFRMRGVHVDVKIVVHVIHMKYVNQ